MLYVTSSPEPGNYTITRKTVVVFQSLSRVQLFCDPMDCSPASQAPESMGFSRQEQWSGLPLPSPGDRPYPRIKPVSSALAGRFFTTEPAGKLQLEKQGMSMIFLQKRSYSATTIVYAEFKGKILTQIFLDVIMADQ